MRFWLGVIGRVLLWIPMLLLTGVLTLLGYIVVPILWRYRNTPFKDLPAWTKPWSNPEDWHEGILGYEGSLPTWWIEREGYSFKSFFQYHARRNSADGIRNFSFFTVPVKDVYKDIQYRTNEYQKSYSPWWINRDGRRPGVYWYWCWVGIYGHFGLAWIWKKPHDDGAEWTQLNWGWKVYPNDKNGIDENSVRYKTGATFGFGTKLRHKA